MDDEKCCGTCRHNRFTRDRRHEGFCCSNGESENYGLFTFYDDHCEDWEEKEDDMQDGC